MSESFRKKKSGFTLIELLAVIVILAVIALIVAPQIINIIYKSRKSAFYDSVKGYISAVENYVALSISYEQEEVKNFYVVDGENNVDISIKGSQKNWNGEMVYDNKDNFRLFIENNNFCAYKDYLDDDIVVEDIKNCDQFENEEGIFEPVISIENEEKITESKNVSIDYRNSNNNNEYCVADIIDNCEWNKVTGKKIKFIIRKNSNIYARSSNETETKSSEKQVKNIGIVEDKAPEITVIHTSLENSITSVVTLSTEMENIKYFYSIDNSEYIESSEPYYTFNNLLENTEYTIKIYVETETQKKSKINETKVLTKESEKNPIIKSFSTSSGEYDITNFSYFFTKIIIFIIFFYYLL